MPSRTISLLAAFAAVVLFICFSLGSCKKTDTTHPGTHLSADAVRALFFKGEPQDARTAALKRRIYRQDQTKPFVTDYVQWAGFPHWDKAMISESSPSATARGAGGGGSSDTGRYEVIYVPFTRDSSNSVGAILVAILTSRDTILKTVYRWQYNQLPLKSAGLAGATAEDFALLFMGIEYEFFGHSSFDLEDSLLFQGQYSNIPWKRLVFSNFSINSRNGLSMVVCASVWVVNHDGQVVGCPPDDLNCNGGHWEDECWPIDFSGDGDYGGDSGGGDGFPGTGGTETGTGGGGWTDNPCRNIAAAGGSNPCDGGSGGPGWVPSATSPADGPCSGSDRAAGAVASLQYALYGAQTAQFAPFTSTTQPEEYYLVNKNAGGTPVPTAIAPTSTTGGVLTGAGLNTIIIFHTHPAGGYPCPSAADFVGLANFSSDFLASYVVAYTGAKYAMVISNYGALQTFISQNPNLVLPGAAAFNQSTTIGAQFTQVESNLVAQGYSGDDAHERALAFIMSQAGVTLVKAAPGSNTFKKIGIQLNNSIFENTDCP